MNKKCPDFVSMMICKWSKYNPKTSQRSTKWIRLEHRWHHSKTLWRLTLVEKCLWPVILCEYGTELEQSGDNFVTLDLPHIASVLRCRKSVIFKALLSYQQAGLIEISPQTGEEKVPYVTYDTERNETKRNVTQRRKATLKGLSREKKSKSEKTDEKKGKKDSGNDQDPEYIPPNISAPPKEPTLGSRIWEAYAEAYRDRYGNTPVRNAKSNSLCAQLGKRLGEEAIKVVRFYLTHDKKYYLEKIHALAPCIADAEGLHTQMVHNHRVTSASAQLQDTRQNNFQAIDRVMEEWDELRKDGCEWWNMGKGKKELTDGK